MLCIICQKEIPRGQRYKSPRYKNVHFCSEKCYSDYLQQKQNTPRAKPNTPYTKLTDYIDKQWSGNINWPYLTQQIKSLCSEYNINYDDIRMMLKYAIEYERVPVKEEYGLMQFLPYLQKSQEFAEQIRENKRMAKAMVDDKEVAVEPNKRKNTKWLNQDLTFD